MIILRDKTYLEQKEFGIISRVGRKIARGRIKMAKKLEKDISNDLKIIKDSELERKRTRLLRGKNLEENLSKEANSHGVLVTNARLSDDSSSALIKNLKKKELEEYKNLNSDNPSALESARQLFGNKKKADVISYPANASVQDLAHEIGHLNTKNIKGVKNRLSNFITHKTDARGEIAKTVSSEVTKENMSRNPGKSALNYIRGKALVREEINANREGRKLLKKHGLPEKYFEDVDKSYNAAENSYKAASRIAWKSPIKNFIKPKHHGRKN